MRWGIAGKRGLVACGGLWALSGCPSAEPGAGASGIATSGGPPGSTGAAESSTGIDTLAEGSGGGTTAAPSVDIACGEPPAAALGAEYEHAFELDPPGAAGTWSVEGLPEGMSFSPFGGSLSGVPTEEGSFELAVSVDGAAGMGQAMCTLEVGPALSVDLSVLARPCLGPGDSIADVVTGGDGSALSCATPAGNGSGTRPQDVTVNADTCVIEGAPTPDEWGTWVWITEVRQAGSQVYVPYCVTGETQAEGSFEVRMTRGSDTNVALEPPVETFAVGEPLTFGGEGDPAFEIRGGCGESACFYGFNFSVGASPFGGDCGQDPCLGLGPSGIVTDKTGDPVGFSHEMFALGPALDEDFAGRPFVLPWELTYCIADNEADCDGSEAILANAGAHLHVSVLMLPESSAHNG